MPIEPSPLTQEEIDKASLLVDDAMVYIFNEYDDDKDGFIARREFFAFLWKLKFDTGYSLNEGQMISCWNAMDAEKKGQVDYKQFVTGLENIYDNYFFAVENGAPIPESVIKLPGFGDDSNSYNTIRFKNSAAVNFFDTIILQDEKKTQETNQKVRTENAKMLAPPEPEFVARRNSSNAGSPKTPVDEKVAEEEEEQEDHGESPSTHEASSADVSRSASFQGDSSSVVRRGSGLARPGGIGGAQDPSRDKKKKEAEEQLQKIMAERHKAERQKREDERLKKKEDERKANEAAANQMMAEPAWKKSIKTAQPI